MQASGKRFSIDDEKIKREARYDGKWVLETNMDLSARETALKYKQLWMVEEMFRSMKSLLETRPIYHKCDETIRGHVFCSFLALVLRKELQDRLQAKNRYLEWRDIINDLDELLEMEISVKGKGYIVRSETKGTAAYSRVFDQLIRNHSTGQSGVIRPPHSQAIRLVSERSDAGL